jgi:phosphomannomutase
VLYLHNALGQRSFKSAPKPESLNNPVGSLSGWIGQWVPWAQGGAIADNPQRVVVDSMYGAGRGVIKSILKGTGCEVREIRGDMNPGFGGVHPEPIARYLGSLAGAISTGMGDFGLATDGDADRIGAMDERGNFVDPHKIMALALRFLVEQRGWQGPVVRTVSTTAIDRLAKRYRRWRPGRLLHRRLHAQGRILIGGKTGDFSAAIFRGAVS